MNERYSDVAVIIPAYNEENSIRTIAEKSLQYSHHVIVVNDGSTDNTVNVLKAYDEFINYWIMIF